MKIFWACVFAKTVDKYEEALEKIREVNAVAAQYLEEIHPDLWATALFRGRRYGHVTSNIAESVNALLIHVKEESSIEIMLSCTSMAERNGSNEDKMVRK